MTSTDYIAKLYDQNVDKYANSNQGAHNASPGGLAAMRMCVETPSFLKAVGNLEGLRVLDAGCGEGNYSRTYKSDKKAAKVVGVDLSSGLIGSAIERETKEQLGIEYRMVDLSRRDTSLEGQFDVVASAMVLMHIPTREALQDVAHHLYAYIDPKKGGRFVAEFVQVEFNVNERPSTWESRYGWIWSTPNNGKTYADGERVDIEATFDPRIGPMHLVCNMWHKKTYESVLEQAGFVNVKWTKPELFTNVVEQLGLPPDFFDPFVRLAPIWILSAEKAPLQTRT